MQTKIKAATPARQRATLSTRSGTSRKAAEPKAAENQPENQQELLPKAGLAVAASGDQLPVGPEFAAAAEQTEHPAPQATQAAAADTQPEPAAEPESAASGARQPAASPAPTAPPVWSSEDESAFQAMSARRKVAGYRGRGKDVGAQVLRVGSIAPNAGTIVAVIVALVAERGTIARGKLLDAMAGATFPHPKAKPTDRGWCQGYVAGAVRDGFLAVATAAPAEKAEL